jgi:DNA-binding winged helix-turn-helix (wHTH) protein
VFDTGRRELHRGAEAVSLAPQVFDLLDYLIRNRERVVSKDDLIAAIWDDGASTPKSCKSRNGRRQISPGLLRSILRGRPVS